MEEMKSSGRNRLFENLRGEHIVDAQPPAAPEGVRVKPLTQAQAEAFCMMAARSLQKRA